MSAIVSTAGQPFVYCPVPKCATITLRQYIARLEGVDWRHPWYGPADRFHREPVDETPEEYPHIALVRHPVDRLVSCWADKVQDMREHAEVPRIVEHGDYLPFFRRYGSLKQMTVLEFARWVCSVPDEDADLHFCSQAAQLKTVLACREVYLLPVDVRTTWSYALPRLTGGPACYVQWHPRSLRCSPIEYELIANILEERYACDLNLYRNVIALAAAIPCRRYPYTRIPSSR